MARGPSRNVPVEGFAGFEVVDEVLGHEFLRLPGHGRETLSIVWKNKVGIGLQGSAFRNFHFDSFPCIHLVFKGIQDFEGSAVDVIVDPARTDRSWYRGHAWVNPAFEQEFCESLYPGLGRSPWSAGDGFHHFRDFQRAVGKEMRHEKRQVEASTVSSREIAIPHYVFNMFPTNTPKNVATA